MNKFLISITAFLLMIQFSNAQTEKGSQSIGADFGLTVNPSTNTIIDPYNNSTTSLTTRNTGFDIGAQYGYFIADKLELGVNLSYNSTVETNYTQDITTTNGSYPVRNFWNDYGGSVSIRKYYMYKNKIGFRTGVYLGYALGSQTLAYSPAYNYDDLNSKSNYYFGGAELDLVYYPLKKMGISVNIFNLEYEHYNVNNTTQGHNNGDYVNLNFVNDGLSLSAFYVFGGTPHLN